MAPSFSKIKETILSKGAEINKLHSFKGHKLSELANCILKELTWITDKYLKWTEYEERDWGQNADIVEDERNVLRCRYSHPNITSAPDTRIQFSYVYLETGVQFNCKKMNEDTYLRYRGDYKWFLDAKGQLTNIELFIDEFWETFHSKIMPPEAVPPPPGEETVSPSPGEEGVSPPPPEGTSVDKKKAG